MRSSSVLILSLALMLAPNMSYAFDCPHPTRLCKDRNGVPLLGTEIHNVPQHSVTKANGTVYINNFYSASPLGAITSDGSDGQVVVKPGPDVHRVKIKRGRIYERPKSSVANSSSATLLIDSNNRDIDVEIDDLYVRTENSRSTVIINGQGDSSNCAGSVCIQSGNGSIEIKDTVVKSRVRSFFIKR